MANILVVDDEQSICWGLSRLGDSMGHTVQTAASAEKGLQLAEQTTPDVVVLDVRLPGMDGLEAMHRFRELIDAPIVVVTAFGDMQTAATAVNNGAFEYLLKPFALDDARVAIERSLSQQPTVDAPTNPDGPEMVGDSPVMQSLFRQIALAANSQANVVLHGESGSGKELAARAIHQHSRVASGPFVAANVAALSESLAESELFGHVDGAFTGASRTRQGLLQRANGGTLFLDEVAEIPLPAQVKLLRAIETQEVTPVGADSSAKTSFRIVAATHQDLKKLIRTGKFRSDLYYRICAFEIHVPALRDRPEDIAPLALHFASQLGGTNVSFAEETIAELKSRKWFGNVRELRNAVEHSLVVARSGPILPNHLPAPQPLLESAELNLAGESNLADMVQRRMDELLDDPKSAGTVYEKLLDELDQAALPRALERFGSEFAPAARALGLHRTTLKKKLDSAQDAE